MGSSVLVTGSSGLVGSACVRHFAGLGFRVRGVDNNARRAYFGEDGDTSGNLARLSADVPGFVSHGLDVRDARGLDFLFQNVRPAVVIHAAAQPSHDYAAREPALDFAVNAVGTLNVLEAARRWCPESPFVFLSTNKVYGDAPNEVKLLETATRWDWPGLLYGVDETMRVDQSRHSLFGASKLAADVLVQEYGQAYGMPTVCFRAGCLTGGAHAGAEQHGFLSYLARCCREGRAYTVYGHKGKQVRDQLHAYDVARACELFAADPSPGAVYNLGGGRDNSVSVLESIDIVQDATGRRLDWSYDERPRAGDHVCYYSDTRKFRRDYPAWEVTRDLGNIVDELCRETVTA